ncbi:MAG: hypothetical protein GEV09_24825 [Pseudonocardiaceae bacterium]|nr:hypothetical protein [Pseudonocardiaceae bacterium]
MHIGIADHLGWAVAVTATRDHEVVDRQRIDLVEPSVRVAPIHHEGGTWAQHGSRHVDDATLAALVTTVRESATRATRHSLDRLAADLPSCVVSISLRDITVNLPDDIAVLRRPPYESRADAIMYRQVIADVAGSMGWEVHIYDARTVLTQAASLLGTRTDDVLSGPRARWGPPWTKDHRVALAAAVVAGR